MGAYSLLEGTGGGVKLDKDFLEKRRGDNKRRERKPPASEENLEKVIKNASKSPSAGIRRNPSRKQERRECKRPEGRKWKRSLICSKIRGGGLAKGV